MHAENAVEVYQVQKRFSKTQKSISKKVSSLLVECFTGKKPSPHLLKDEFLALNDISFSVKKEETIAILGHNGAGKSTLLKMLNGIYLPDHGHITTKGIVASVLELSTGFNDKLTGRQNIYFKGSMHGMNSSEISEIENEIINFSELDNFIDTPLKHYSSGMKARLGFAIVANMKPDILILDEVFAVGDKNFKIKSENVIKSLSESTTTIIVSHSMAIVRAMAQRTIVLSKGKLIFDGDTEEAIKIYEKQ